jgi:hypothetical protein
MSSAANLYHSVISDVVTSIRESFLDESVDENVLMELKQLWTHKLDASKTIEPAAPRGAAQSADALDARMVAARQGGSGTGLGRATAARGGASTSGAAGMGAGGGVMASSSSAGGQQVPALDSTALCYLFCFVMLGI